MDLNFFCFIIWILFDSGLKYKMNCKICYKLYYEVINMFFSFYVSLIFFYEFGRNLFCWVLNVCVGNCFEIIYRVFLNEEILNRGGVVCFLIVFLMLLFIFFELIGVYYYNIYWYLDVVNLNLKIKF